MKRCFRFPTAVSAPTLLQLRSVADNCAAAAAPGAAAFGRAATCAVRCSPRLPPAPPLASPPSIAAPTPLRVWQLLSLLLEGVQPGSHTCSRQWHPPPPARPAAACPYPCLLASCALSHRFPPRRRFHRAAHTHLSSVWPVAAVAAVPSRHPPSPGVVLSG